MVSFFLSVFFLIDPAFLKRNSMYAILSLKEKRIQRMRRVKKNILKRTAAFLAAFLLVMTSTPVGTLVSTIKTVSAAESVDLIDASTIESGVYTSANCQNSDKISGTTAPLDRDATVYAKFRFNFKDKLQDGDTLTYTYQLPSNIHANTVTNGVGKDDQSVESFDYTIDANGLVTIKMRPQWIAEHNDKTYAQVILDLKLDEADEAGKDEVVYSFPGTGTSVTIPLKEGKVTNKSKGVSRDDTTGIATWNVNFSVNSNLKDFVITDELGSDLDYVKGTFLLDGQSVSADVAGKTATVNLGTVQYGSHTLTYQTKLAEDAVANADGSFSNDTNNASFKWQGKTEEKTDRVDGWIPDAGYFYHYIGKSGNINGEDISWTVTLNDGNVKAEVAGKTYTDTLGANQKYTGSALIKDSAGNVVKTVALDETAGSFSYTFPEDAKADKYTVTYTTKTTAKSASYKNKANFLGQETDASVNGGSYEMTSKSVDSSKAESDGVATWTILVDATQAPNGLTSLKIKDNASANWPGEWNDLALQNDSFVVEVGGRTLTAGVDYRLNITSQHEYELEFLNASSEPIKELVKVTYKTDINKSSSFTYKNNANVTYTTDGAEFTENPHASFAITKHAFEKKIVSEPKYDANLGGWVVGYQMFVNTDNTYTADGAGKEDLGTAEAMIIDHLPDGMTYVAGSGKLGPNSWSMKAIEPERYNAETGELTFAATVNGKTPINVEYQALVSKDVLEPGKTKNFDNKAIFSFGSDGENNWGPVVASTAITSDVLEKTGASDGGDCIEYTVNINKQGYDLVPKSDTIVLSDTPDSRTSFLPRSVKLLDAAGNDISTEVRDSVTDGVVSFTLPDSKPVVLKYSVKMKGDVGTVLTDVSNSISLNGKSGVVSGNKANYKINASKASGGGSKNFLYINKFDKDNSAKVLEGAKFALYKFTGDIETFDASSVSNLADFDLNSNYFTKVGEGISSKSGGLQLKDNNADLDPASLYYFKEIEAPEGYELDASTKYPIWVMLSDPDAYNVTKIEAAHAAAKKLVTAWVNAVNDPEMADLSKTVSEDTDFYLYNRVAQYRYLVTKNWVDADADKRPQVCFSAFVFDSEANAYRYVADDEKNLNVVTGKTYRGAETGYITKKTTADGDVNVAKFVFASKDINGRALSYKIVELPSSQANAAGDYSVELLQAFATNGENASVTVAGKTINASDYVKDGKVSFDAKGNVLVSAEVMNAISTQSNVKGYTATFTQSDSLDNSDPRSTYINTNITDVNTKITEEFLVSIDKVDVNGARLAGAELAVKNADGKTVASFTSDADKKHELKLAPGTYTLTEVKAPSAAYAKAEDITFVVASDGKVKVNNAEVATVTMTDDYAAHEVSVEKTDINGKLIAGAAMEIRSGSTVVDSWTTTTAAHKASLKPGTYTVVETQAPEGYEKAANQTLVVENDGSFTVDGKAAAKVTVVDEYKDREVRILKTDLAGAGLAGAKLKVTKADAAKMLVAEWTSTADVKTISVQPGNYILTEVAAPSAAYIVADDIAFAVGIDGKVTVSGKAVEAVTMINTLKGYDVAISKVDVTGAALSGASLEVLDKATGKTVKSFTSGTAEEKVNVTAGTYVLHEVSAPSANYKLASDIEFVVTEEGKVTVSGKEVSKVAMTDEYADHQVVLSKQDVNGNLLAGAALKVTERSGAEVASFTSSTANKTITVKPGTYVLSEISTPSSAYAKASDIEFTVAVDGKITVAGKSVALITMVDEYVPHAVSISKTDVAGAALAGAMLKVTKADAARTVVAEFTSTAEDKKISVPAGSYILTEVAVPSADYVLAADIAFEVSENGKVTVAGKEVTKVVMIDETAAHEISLTKVKEDGTALSGASLEIKDAAGKTVESFTSSDVAHKISLVAGTYTLHEVKAPAGFVTASDVTFVVETDGTVQVAGKTVTAVSMTDAYDNGSTSVKVTKVWDDKDNADKLRPESLTVALVADGVKTGNTLVLTEKENWQGEFNGLAEKKNGDAIVYTVEEESFANSDKYTATVTGTAKDGFTITNSHTVTEPEPEKPDDGPKPETPAEDPKPGNPKEEPKPNHTPETPPTPFQPPIEEEPEHYIIVSSKVSTGDTSKTVLYAVILIVAAGVLAFATRTRKKDKE